MVKELRNTKKETRVAYYKKLEDQKVLIDKHDKVVMLNQTIRMMQNLLNEKKKHNEETGPDQPDGMFDDEKLKVLGDKVQSATKDMTMEQKKIELAAG